MRKFGITSNLKFSLERIIECCRKPPTTKVESAMDSTKDINLPFELLEK